MSLARLLTTGKALTTLRDAPTSYRVRHSALLPKFGAGGNPFASVDEPAGTAALSEPAVAPTKGASARRSIWPWKWRGAKKEAVTAIRQAPPTRPGPAPNARPPRQGELSLANVRVVRNDLHESDVDLVFRPSGAKPAQSAVASNRWSRATVAERALDRLAARIMSVEPR